MAKGRSPWHVERRQSGLEYAFFVSHVREDAKEVQRVVAALGKCSKQAGLSLRCFLDVNDWPIGNDISSAIRTNLLKAEYLLAWITPAYLQGNRGWVWIELGYAELLELSINAGRLDIDFPYIVPVFRNVGIKQVERTPLLGYWQRRLPLTAKNTPEEVANQLVSFYLRQA